jgi:hypothetical protein
MYLGHKRLKEEKYDDSVNVFKEDYTHFKINPNLMIKFCANIDQIIKIMKITNSDLKCLLSPLYIIPKNTDRGMPSFGIVYPRMEQSLRLYMNGFEKSFSLSLYIIYKIWGCII